MMKNALIVATDSRYAAGMAALARSCADSVVAIAVGCQELADKLAASGVDKVLYCPAAAETAPESFAGEVAAKAQELEAALVVSNDAAASRVLLTSAAKALGASVLGDVIAVAADGEALVASCLTAGGIAVQDVSVTGPLAAIYGGADADAPADAAPAPVEECAAVDAAQTIPVVERILPAADAVDLSAARYLVGVGRGVKTKDDLADIEALASQLGAAMACTLPVSEDSNWYPAEQVLGSSHNSAAPELYIALGISGSPNHLSGVKDAGVVVAVNNDPEAPVFKHCDFGIVADLYGFVPALKDALA